MDIILKSHFNNFKKSFEMDTTTVSSEENREKEAIAFEKFVNYILFSLDHKHFIHNTFQTKEKDIATIYEGTILKIISTSDRWYGFIRRGFQYENVYFDNRVYKGDITKLIPKTKVCFEMENDTKPRAKRVETID
jgi:cold shock CspA family protein